MSARAFAVFIAVLAVIGLLGYGLLNKSAEALEPGEAVPATPLRSSKAGNGSVADYRGGWVLVNVWASWCTPCRDESPALERFYRAHRGQRFTVLGIDSNDPRATRSVRPQVRHHLSAAPRRDGGFSQEELGRRAFPSPSWSARRAGWCCTASAR